SECEIKLRVIGSILLQCTVLLKQSTSTNVTHEEFVKATYNYATDLVTCSSESKELCSQRINQLNKDRDNISLFEPKNRAFMERDPGKLEAHFSSVAHKASYERYFIFKNKSCNVDNLLNENCRKAKQQEEAILKRNRNIIITLIDAVRVLARQKLPFRNEPAEEGNREN
ncbi:unnamed protein product, partial [Rotaria sordida]